MWQWIQQYVLKIVTPTNDNASLENVKDTEITFDSEHCFSQNGNFLLIAGKRKKSKSITENFVKHMSSLFGTITRFSEHVNVNAATSATMISKEGQLPYDASILEEYILKQRSLSETFELIPQLVVFDRCVKTVDESYEGLLTEGFCDMTTLTIVDDVRHLEPTYLKHMNVVLFTKESVKSKYSTMKSIWMMTKRKGSWEDFSKKIVNVSKRSDLVVMAQNRIQGLSVNKNGFQFDEEVIETIDS